MRRQHLMKQILETSRHLWDHPGPRPAVRENFSKMRLCRTPALGWELYASETEEKRCYHTCKSRFCPSCGYRATLLWQEEQKAVLPEIPYVGVVFTMSNVLWRIFQQNRHLVHDLPAIGAAVIQQWVKVKYGLSVLVLVVPHTFGGDLKFNTHLHILVSAGGLQESESRWVPRVGFNKTALMRMWRYAVIAHLRAALKAKVLKSDLEGHELRRVLTSEYERDYWIIYIDQLLSKAHFVRYAARYVRRLPIAQRRLLRVTDREVEFLAKDKTKRLVPTRYSLQKFVTWLAEHVPDRYRHAIRYFGLLAPRSKGQTWASLFAILGQPMRPRPERLSWRDSLLKHFGTDPLIDCRGEVMHWVGQEWATTA